MKRAASSKSKRALIVEDNETLAAIFQEELESNGFETSVAWTLDQALRAISEKTFHVASVDIMLGELATGNDGVILLKRLQELDEGTAAVVVSATPRIEAIRSSFDAGAVDFVQKANLVDLKSYVDSIEKACDGRKLKLFGRFPDVGAYLCWPDDRTVAKSRLCEFANRDPAMFERDLTVALQPFFPILRLSRDVAALSADDTVDGVTGMFWSKSIGAAIFLVLGSEAIDSAVPEFLASRFGETSTQVLSDSTGYHQRLGVWRLESCRRDKFLELRDV